MKNRIVRSIDTSYKGYRFRSRLEARWAVFFDMLEVKWEYEPEGFALPNNGPYLPDFWLPFRKYLDEDWPVRGWYVEIKPTAPDAIAISKAQELARETGHDVIFLIGTTGDDSEFLKYCFRGQEGEREYCGRYREAFTKYRSSLGINLDFDSFINCLFVAETAARSARFEYDER